MGHSFAVHVPNDEVRDTLLRVFVEDARKQKPTKVFLKGTLYTHEAPTQVSKLTGLYIKVSSPKDIQAAELRG